MTPPVTTAAPLRFAVLSVSLRDLRFAAPFWERCGAWIAPPIHTLTALTRAGERVDGFLGQIGSTLRRPRR